MSQPSDLIKGLSIVDLVGSITSQAKEAQIKLGQSSHSERNSALTKIAERIRASSNKIISANKLDLANAIDKQLSASFIDRLTLTLKVSKLWQLG